MTTALNTGYTAFKQSFLDQFENPKNNKKTTYINLHNVCVVPRAILTKPKGADADKKAVRNAETTKKQSGEVKKEKKFREKKKRIAPENRTIKMTKMYFDP